LSEGASLFAPYVDANIWAAHPLGHKPTHRALAIHPQLGVTISLSNTLYSLSLSRWGQVGSGRIERGRHRIGQGRQVTPTHAHTHASEAGAQVLLPL